MSQMLPKDCTQLFGVDPATGMKVWQITEDGCWHANVYPETPVFLEDRRSFLISSEEGYQILYMDRQYASRKILDSAQGRYASILVAPSGKYIYYIELKGEGEESTAALCRMDTVDFQPETLCVIEGKIPGTDYRPSHFYGIGTVSSDEKRFATSCYLGDGTRKNDLWGLLVFDMEKGTVSLAAADPEFANSHLQYCKSTDPEASHDLLNQMNHGLQSDETGKVTCFLEPPPSGLGVDIHVMRDDGANWRDLPWGRDGRESCIGHQAWRGAGTSAVTVTLEAMDPTYGFDDATREEVVEGWPVPADRNAPHMGATLPKTRRRILSCNFRHPRFCHFFMSNEGDKFALDTFPIKADGDRGQRIYTGYTVNDGPIQFRYILNNGGRFVGENSIHAHPILTPDSRHLLFNSTISGKSQIYLVENVLF